MFVVSGGKAIQAGGDFKASWPFPSGTRWTYNGPLSGSIPLLYGKRWATYEQIVRSQPWVFAGITRLCSWGSRIPVGAYSGARDDADPVVDNDLATLIRKPNKRMGWRRFMRDEVIWDYMTHGNSLSWKFRPSAGAPPTELWPIPWKFVTEIRDEAERIMAYQLWLGAETFTLTPDQVLHCRWPRGISPLEALARTLGIEDAALTFQSESLRNGVMPRASFSSEDALNDTDMKRMRAELDKLYAGPEAGGRYAIFDKKLKYDKPIGVSAVDLALIEQRRLSREEVASALDVSPPFLGILDRATFNNIAELRDMNFRDAVGPKYDAIVEDFQDQVVDVEPVWERAGLFVKSQMDSLLVPSPEALSRQELMEQQSATTTTDERRVRRGLRPLRIKGVTDVPLIPLNMAPAGTDPMPAPPPEPAASLHDELVLAAIAAGGGNGSGHDPEEDGDEA